MSHITPGGGSDKCQKGVTYYLNDTLSEKFSQFFSSKLKKQKILSLCHAIFSMKGINKSFLELIVKA